MKEKKIQVGFSESALKKLHKLKERTNAASYAEVIRYALGIYSWIVEEQQQGLAVCSCSIDKPNETYRIIRELVLAYCIDEKENDDQEEKTDLSSKPPLQLTT